MLWLASIGILKCNVFKTKYYGMLMLKQEPELSMGFGCKSWDAVVCCVRRFTKS